MSDTQSCRHPHLMFDEYGFQLRCIDCSRRWLAVKAELDVLDYTYTHPDLTTFETRHSMFVTPRTRAR